MGSVEFDGYPVSLEKSDTEKRRNVQKRTGMCTNVRKHAQTCNLRRASP